MIARSETELIPPDAQHGENQDRGPEVSTNWEADSTLGLDENMDDQSTQSITSSILAYTYENGRRYHAYRSGQYFMPNDAEEMQAMDLMHHISGMLLNGELFRAPIKDPLNILDIGTGTGIWAIDVADKFPSAYVIGTDLSPIQPTWVSPNVQFDIDDCESEWSFKQEFDFIHMRNMSGSIADWPLLFQRCYDQLKPGGWIEIANLGSLGKSHNHALPRNSATYRWQRNMVAAAAQFGRPFAHVKQLATMLRKAGFKDVSDNEVHVIPASPWMSGQREQELALYFQFFVMKKLDAISLALFTRVLGWTREQLKVLLEQMIREITNEDYQMYCTMHYMYGQKPLD